MPGSRLWRRGVTQIDIGHTRLNHVIRVQEAPVTDAARQPTDAPTEAVSMEDIDAEAPVALPNKEVLSLLDINANVDLGLDLAAPVDLAAAANLNVAAPIEAAASANVLSPDAQAVGLAEQHGTLDQTMSGSATATAPQHAGVTQDSSGTTGGVTGGTATDGTATDGTAGVTGDTTGTTAAEPTTGTTDPVGTTTGDVTGGAENLLNGGSLLDANVNIDANANLAAPLDGAVAANANVAAPIDAAVAANVGSDGATAEALAPQELDVQQTLDGVSADATATQDANVNQQ
jgi:hypothetical protein